MKNSEAELARLQEQRRMLQERQKELDAMCASLEQRINSIRDRVTDTAESVDPAKTQNVDRLEGEKGN